jgi:hypothetical protein
VLAGVRKSFALGLSRKDCNGIDSLSIDAVTDEGHKTASFAVNPALCSAIEENKPAKSETTEHGKSS